MPASAVLDKLEAPSTKGSWNDGDCEAPGNRPAAGVPGVCECPGPGFDEEPDPASRPRESKRIRSSVSFARTKGVGELLSASTEVRAATVDATESIPLAWGDRFAGRREGLDGLGGDCDSARLDWLAALESVASTVDGFSLNPGFGLAERASRWMTSPFFEPDSTGRIDGVGAVVARFRWARVGSETPFWTVSSRVFAEGSAPLVSEVRAIVDGVGSTEDRPVAKGELGFCFESLSLKRPPNEGAKSVVKLGRAPVPGSRMRLRNASLLLAGRTDTPATGDVPRSCDCATARRAASRTSLEIKSMPIDGSEAVADRDVGND